MMEICFPEAEQESSGNNVVAKDADKEFGINRDPTAVSVTPEEQQIHPKGQSFEGSINLATEICAVVIDRLKKNQEIKDGL